MARIDEPIQDKEGSAREFLRWSEPIESIPADQSKAKMYEGIETAVKEGSHELNQAAGKYVKDTSYTEGEKEQAKYLSSVEGVYSSVTGKDPTTGESSSTPDSLTTPKDAELPSQVTAGLDKVSKLKAAYDQGAMPGHVRETMYDAAIYNTAQRLRERFPTYRDQVDAGIEKATGRTPTANQYVKDMLADINEIATKKNEGTNKILNEMITKGYEIPGFDGTLKNVMSGKEDIWSAYHKFNVAMSFKYPADIAKARVSIMESDDKTRQRAASDYITPTANNMAVNSVAGIYGNHGMNDAKMAEYAKIQTEGGRTNPDGSKSYIDPKTLIPDETWRAMGTEVQQSRVAGMAQLMASLNKRVPM